MIVADSDVLIDALSGIESAQKRIDLELGTGGLATTVVTVFELLSGAQTDSQRLTVDALLSALRILGLDEETGRRAAEIRRQLEAEGRGLAMADYLIAAACLTRNAVLLTRNRAHFERVPGLTLGRL